MSSKILSAENILYIFKKLNENQTIYVKRLNEEMNWNMSERNIVRYFDTIESVFPKLFTKGKDEKGIYYKPNHSDFIKLNPSSLAMTAITYSLMPKKEINRIFSTLENESKKVIRKEMKEINQCYRFITRPFENIDTEIMKKIEECIKNKLEITLAYDNTLAKENKTVRPYKIIFIDENFYLACLCNGEFNMLRISFIKNLKEENKFQYIKSKVDNFIENGLQTSFSDYNSFIKNNVITVKLKISEKVARYFTHKKKFFDSQRIENLESGEKIATYEITNFKEIMPFIKKWIPHIEVIEPKELREQILKDIKEYQIKNIL
ncbi:WYL domain-containing protein [Campylobacter sp. RM16190]|uniref:WYL domain-containing protein n=1 Tax=Campylobacter sp. RM16190 TaxID=1705727 RepID=UPI0014742493|nr:WYL domain-containing protein [Campylobacter sp. RM16190]